jgi:hypothetical protein
VLTITAPTNAEPKLNAALRDVALRVKNLPLTAGPLVSRGGDGFYYPPMEDFMLKRLSTLVAAGAFVALLAPAAQAFTPAPLTASPDTILVAQGCGPGFHRDLYGRCRPNGGVVVGGPVVGGPVVACRRVWIQGYGWRRRCI